MLDVLPTSSGALASSGCPPAASAMFASPLPVSVNGAYSPDTPWIVEPACSDPTLPEHVSVVSAHTGEVPSDS